MRCIGREAFEIISLIYIIIIICKEKWFRTNLSFSLGDI